MPKSPSRSLSGRRWVRGERWTPEKASAVLAKHAASGLSIQGFAAREGLDAERLYRWRRQLGAADPAPAAAFVEIRGSGRSRIEVVLRSGHVLFVSESIEAGALRRVPRLLGSACFMVVRCRLGAHVGVFRSQSGARRAAAAGAHMIELRSVTKAYATNAGLNVVLDWAARGMEGGRRASGGGLPLHDRDACHA